jgi:hypothetical protein
MELLRLSRDVPVLGPIRLAAAWQLRAGMLFPWNLCRFGLWSHVAAGAVRQ